MSFGFLNGLCVLCLAQYSEKLGVPFFGRDICHEGSLGAMGHLRVGVQPLLFPVLFAFPLNVLYLDNKCIFRCGFPMALVFGGVEFLRLRRWVGQLVVFHLI